MRKKFTYGHQIRQLLSFAALASLALSCEKLVWIQEVDNEDYAKVYLTRGAANIYAIDIKPSGDEGYYLLGLTGTYMESKMDASEDLYVTKVDAKGDQEWEVFHRMGSRAHNFPTNIVSKEDHRLYMLWNDGPGQHYSVILNPEKGPDQIDKKVLELPYQVHYLMYLCEKTDPENGYLVLTLGSQRIGDTTFYQLSILSTDKDFTGFEVLSVYEYDPGPISGYADNEPAFISYIQNVLYLGQIGDRYFFNGPVKDRIALQYVGDYQQIYSHEEFLISDLTTRSDGTVDVLLQNPYRSGSEIYRASGLELAPVNRSLGDLSTVAFPPELQALDPGEKAFLLDSGLVGTLLSQQVVIYNKGKTEILGSTYPYKAAGILLDRDQTLMVVGTTRMHYLEQRMFLIKYKL